MIFIGLLKSLVPLKPSWLSFGYQKLTGAIEDLVRYLGYEEKRPKCLNSLLSLSRG